jgi:hypothetical protein
MGLIRIDGKTADGTQVQVAEYEVMKFDIRVNGKNANLTQDPIRYKDGGTTILYTDRGRIYSPSPFYEGRVPTLNEQRITPV